MPCETTPGPIPGPAAAAGATTGKTVTQIQWLAVHQRTATHDGGGPDAARATLLESLGCDASGPERAVEPDVLDTAFDCFARDGGRNRRVRDNHEAVHGTGHGTNIRVALLPLDL